MSDIASVRSRAQFFGYKGGLDKLEENAVENKEFYLLTSCFNFGNSHKDITKQC